MPHCTSTTHLLPGTSCAGSCKFALDTEDHPPPKSIWHRNKFHCAEEMHWEGGNFQWPAVVASVGSGAAFSFQHWWQPLLPLPPLPSLPVSASDHRWFPSKAKANQRRNRRRRGKLLSFALRAARSNKLAEKFEQQFSQTVKFSNWHVFCPLSCCHIFSLSSIIFPKFPCILIFLKGFFSPHLGLTPQTFQWS